VFADVLLADEVNRTTPRTQSALLEAMAERQVTVDNVRHTLTPTFCVIATQNPIEHHGTYPLPEAQLDRFAMKLSIGYPERHDEMDLLAAAVGEQADSSATTSILAEGQLADLQDRVARLTISASVQAYLVDLGRATRAHPQVTLGLSPRGLLIWQRVAQARAFLEERPFVTPDDVQQVAPAVLAVRLGLAPEAAGNVVRQLLESIPVPI
jgi:MoxR-like ATPase